MPLPEKSLYELARAVQLLQMKLTYIVLALALVAIPPCVAQTLDGFVPAYELYSWPESNGVWDFCLVRSPSGVYTPAKVLFERKLRIRGVNELKRKISELPAGTQVIWFDQIGSEHTAKAPDNKSLAFPSPETLNELKGYAQTHKVHVEVHSANPFKTF